jgi:RNA polymerase sigma-70 factor (ECF subfamily)
MTRPGPPSAGMDFENLGEVDPETFGRLVESHRREIQLHCYRMLGSVQEAEDVVQESFLHAWQGRYGFEGRGAFRGWLYRIATNASLDALKRRAASRRVLGDPDRPPSRGAPEGGPATEVAWLEPYPDSYLEGVADGAPGPHARYEMREAVKLAFVAAIQQLPPRQRAILLLRDVLGWSAGEAGQLLGGSTASVNSALQRARATLARHYPAGEPAAAPFVDEQQRALLDRYMRAWERFDLDGFVELLRKDAVFRMPPWRQWYRGRDAIRGFFAWAWAHHGAFRVVPTGANRQPAFAIYVRREPCAEWRAHSVWLLELQGAAIASLTGFVDPLGPRLFAAFGLPETLPDRLPVHEANGADR